MIRCGARQRLQLRFREVDELRHRRLVDGRRDRDGRIGHAGSPQPDSDGVGGGQLVDEIVLVHAGIMSADRTVVPRSAPRGYAHGARPAGPVVEGQRRRSSRPWTPSLAYARPR